MELEFSQLAQVASQSTHSKLVESKYFPLSQRQVLPIHSQLPLVELRLIALVEQEQLLHPHVLVLASKVESELHVKQLLSNGPVQVLHEKLHYKQSSF